ncbi:MAG: cobyric acid synthase [Chloroflexota bacterium]
MAQSLMIQGTGSSVGKSILVTALCRILRQDGWSVAPFKSQNMALNSFVTRDGREMGRAQVVQAEAAGIEPAVEMNPILIKPEADAQAQVVVLGKPAMTLSAGEYYRHTLELLAIAEESLSKLRSQYDIVLIEGAGSPAEVNLKKHEIVNMRIAKLAQAPVLLVGDIDKGGVFASLVGTLALLEDDEREMIKAFVINKFRGEIALLQPGLDFLEGYTNRPVLGVIPYYHGIVIAQEDSVYQGQGSNEGSLQSLDIAVIHLPRISNSTDFEVLQQEAGVRLRYVPLYGDLGEPDLIVLPGSKSTIADLALLRERGLDRAITQRARAGTPVIGICGGYQMLGRELKDPKRIESQVESTAGLGLLDTITVFEEEKATCQVQAAVSADKGLLSGCSGLEVTGYEIHMGRTTGNTSSAFRVVQRPDGPADYPDGAVNEDGSVFGTYLHGLFDNAAFRYALLGNLRQRKGMQPAARASIPSKEEHYNALAEHVRRNLKMDLFYQICGLER